MGCGPWGKRGARNQRLAGGMGVVVWLKNTMIGRVSSIVDRERFLIARA